MMFNRKTVRITTTTAALTLLVTLISWESQVIFAASKTDEKVATADLAADRQLSIVGQPKSLQLLEGANGQLSCEAFGTPVPTIQWLRNGKLIRMMSADAPENRLALATSPNMIERLSNRGLRTFQMSTTSSKIHVGCASKDDVGTYTCVASNGRDSVTANATVQLISKDNALLYGNRCQRKRSDEKMSSSPAQIYMWTDSRMERPGVSVQLMCRAAGKPEPKIDWYESDSETSELRQITPDDDRFSILSNGDLLVKETPVDLPLSMFQCQASNKFGQDSVNIMLLEITDDTQQAQQELTTDDNQQQQQGSAATPLENFQ